MLLVSSTYFWEQLLWFGLLRSGLLWHNHLLTMFPDLRRANQLLLVRCYFWLLLVREFL